MCFLANGYRTDDVLLVIKTLSVVSALLSTKQPFTKTRYYANKKQRNTRAYLSAGLPLADSCRAADLEEGEQHANDVSTVVVA
jgi:hypothetical protein